MKQFVIMILSGAVLFQSEIVFAQTLTPTANAASLVDVANGENVSLAFPRQTEEELKDMAFKGESYFNRLRLQLNKLDAQSASLAEKRGVALSSAFHLPRTKMAFHVIDGALFALESWTNAGANPMKMVEHLNSTFDRTAWFSFYVFSASQGYYINFKSKDISPELKAKAMKQLMYKGMVFGSLFSTLTTDVINTFHECQMKRLDPKSNPAEIDKACDQALKTWTSRNLLNKFGPQITNLIANQLASDWTEKGVKLIASTKPVVKATEMALAKIEKFLLVNGFEIAISVSPVGLEVYALKGLFTAMKFTNFLAWDHFLAPITYKVSGNVTFSWSSMVDISSIERLSNWFSTQRWDLENLKSRSDQRVNQFPEAVADFTQFMNEWRNQLNRTNEEKLDGWLKVEQNLIHQLSYLKNAYNKLSDIVYDGSKKETFPFISLPLYGVNPGYNEKEIVHYNQYILNNQQLEKDQLARLNRVVTEFEKSYTQFHYLTSQDLDLIKYFLTEVKSNDLKRISKVFDELNVALHLYDSKFNNSTANRAYLSTRAITLLTKLRNEIGDPRPIFNSGIAFTYAFNALDTNAILSKQANFPVDSKYNGVRLNFENPMAYVMYNMICGSDKASIYENYTNGASLVIPKIITRDQTEYCKNIQTFSIKNLYRFGLNGVDTTSFFYSKIDDQSVVDYLTNPANLIQEFHGRGSNANLFASWWKKHEVNYLKEFDKVDQRVFPIISETLKKFSDVGHDNLSLLDEGTTFFFASYLPKTIKESLVFELKVLLKMYQSYTNRNKREYTALGADYIVNLKKEIEKNSSQFIYPKNKEMIDELKKIREKLFDKYFEYAFVAEDVTNDLSDVKFNEKIKKATDRFNQVSFKEKSKNSKEIKEKTLRENQQGFIRTLRLITMTRAVMLQKFEETKDKKYQSLSLEIEAIQNDFTKKFNIEILEGLTLDLMELFQSDKQFVNLEEISSLKMYAEIYLVKLLGLEQQDTLETLKKSASLDARFVYAINGGLSSVIQAAARYSNLLITMEDRSKMSDEEIKALVESRNSGNSQQNSSSTNKGFRPGSAKTQSN